MLIFPLSFDFLKSLLEPIQYLRIYLISSIFEQIFHFHFDHIVHETRGQNENGKDAKKRGIKKCLKYWIGSCLMDNVFDFKKPKSIKNTSPKSSQF